MTTNLTDNLEWRPPTNLKAGITNGEPARVRWPEDAMKPLPDYKVPWKYGYLVWDYWMDMEKVLRTGQVRFMYGPDQLMDIDNRSQVQVQRPKRGLGR